MPFLLLPQGKRFRYSGKAHQLEPLLEFISKALVGGQRLAKAAAGGAGVLLQCPLLPTWCTVAVPTAAHMLCCSAHCCPHAMPTSQSV